MAIQAPKKVPKWALYAGGGAVVVGGVLYLKNKNAPSSSSSATDTADTSGMTGFTDGQNMPGIVVAPSSPPDLSGLTPPPGPDTSAILSSIADIIGSLLPGGIPVGGGGGSVGGSGNPGGTVTVGGGGTPAPVANPGPAPSNPCVGMQAGGSAGSCHPAGAICRQMLKCDSNSNGHYCTWKFKFHDGHTACYNHYSSGKKAGQCIGPFGCP